MIFSLSGEMLWSILTDAKFTLQGLLTRYDKTKQNKKRESSRQSRQISSISTSMTLNPLWTEFWLYFEKIEQKENGSVFALFFLLCSFSLLLSLTFVNRKIKMKRKSREKRQQPKKKNRRLVQIFVWSFYVPQIADPIKNWAKSCVRQRTEEIRKANSLDRFITKYRTGTESTLFGWDWDSSGKDHTRNPLSQTCDQEHQWNNALGLHETSRK